MRGMRLIRRLKRMQLARLEDVGAPSMNGTYERSPFLAARREFASAFGDLAKGKRNWQVVAFSLLALLAVVTLAYVRLAAGARVVPYIVEVDKFGQVTAVAPATELKAPEPRLIASQLADFIRSIRTVLPAAAAAAQREMLARAYAFTTADAAGFLNSYFSDPKHDPRVLGSTLSREVAVTSVLQVPKSPAWTVRWTETDTPAHAGGPPRTTAWEGYLVVTLMPPTSESVVRSNPLGVYITAINWTQLAETMGETP